MSSHLSRSEIISIQRTCAACDIYKGPLDGNWSAAVDEAESHFIGEAAKIKATLGSFDKRTEDKIATLLIPAQRIARQFMKIAGQHRDQVKIISGSRTYIEQDALYTIGRTTELNRSPVTKAKGGHSNHNFGIAWDVGIFRGNGDYMKGINRFERDSYRDLASLVKDKLPNVEWGGDWEDFQDLPHYQLSTGKSLDTIRAAFETGEVFAT